MTALQVLSTTRINNFLKGLQNAFDVPKALLFLGRTPLVPATDNEIIARTIDRVVIADLIANDQGAAVYSAGKFALESTVIPNLKLGINISQDMLNQLQSFGGQALPSEDANFFTDYHNRTIAKLLLGTRQRMEALIVGMWIDNATYDRLGIKFTGTFGMPSDLKVTVSITWDTAASATPVGDILAVKLTGSVRYGINYDRATMSTQAFRYMIATTEFQNKARMYLAPNVSFVNVNQADLSFQKSLAANVLGMEVELYDSRYWYQNTDGTTSSAPFLPINKVVLSSIESDNDANVMDFGNALVTESLVSDFAGGSMIGGGLGGKQFGPVAYATAPPDLNPPSVTTWGVARGFPRKKMLQATAVLTVGTFLDTIPVAEPTVL